MLENVQKIHLIGAGGIGVSAVGKLFLHSGKQVSGSDVAHNEQIDALRKLGAKITLGQSVDNVTSDLDLIIYSPAVPMDNVERVAGRDLELIEMSYPEFLGELAKDYKTIAVSGTHGKSTTTAMIGLILEAAGLDPTVIVGSKVKSWPDGNLRLGSSSPLLPEEGLGVVEGVEGIRPLLVLEACEHMAGMLHIHPDIALITNIEMDHPDFYRDLDHVKETVEHWVQEAPLAFLNGDDPHCQSLPSFSRRGKGVVVYSSLDPQLDGLHLMIPGAFNLMNAHAAAAVAKHLGVSDEVIVDTLNKFPGLWRRFERIGTYHGADVFSDYAHHPTAIKKTLEGARQMFPGRRIVLCFQPHQHARTKELFDQFVPSFDFADKIILAEIYLVAGRLEEQGEISSRDLVAAVQKRGKDVHYAADLIDAQMQLKDTIQSGDIVLVMGAGDIDDVARKFI